MKWIEDKEGDLVNLDHISVIYFYNKKIIACYPDNDDELLFESEYEDKTLEYFTKLKKGLLDVCQKQ